MSVLFVVLLAVLTTLGVITKHQRWAAIGSLTVAGLMLVLQAARDLAFALRSPELSTHLRFHYSMASAFTLGLAIAFVLLAFWPIRSGELWGWKAAIGIGAFPSLAVISGFAVETLKLQAAYVPPHVHPSYLVIALSITLAVALAWPRQRSIRGQ